MTPADLSRIEGLLEKATPGPLDIERRDDDCGYMNYILHGGHGDYAWFRDELDPRAKQNAEFIAALRNAAPALIALARRALELESALNYLHKESPMSTSDFEPHAILMLAKQLGWSPTAKGEANG